MAAPAAPGVLFRGLPIKLGGVDYVLPALSIGGLFEAKDLMHSIDSSAIDDFVQLGNAFTDVLHIALQRNYPDLPKQLLLDTLDWPTVIELYHTLLRISLPQAPAGESRAESPSGASTGS